MKPTTPVALRCAIYTRKSTEEGLEQDFNSLHAQREACEAYIKSQQHEGWTLVPTVYDDGGYSGGTLERPGIQKLLSDVANRKIQIIVVYKVDRLTRSLADFARIVETLDRQGASFVSVTQQFNTTSSMGRLTLNVLLSFAQFEREVTGERIRDKIAASKRKGLWMGGSAPLGYAPKDRTLVVVPSEAVLVRRLFARYLELKSVHDLVTELNGQGNRTPQRTRKSGSAVGGTLFGLGAIHYLLRNPVYLGRIRHKGSTYSGQHEPIIDYRTWDKVQEQLSLGTNRSGGNPAIGSTALLRGKLFDTARNRMTPTFSSKSDGRRYRAYTSTAVLKRRSITNIQVTRVAAGVIEPIVRKALAEHPDAPSLADVQRIVVGTQSVSINYSRREADESSKVKAIEIPVQLRKRGQETMIVPVSGYGELSSAEPNRALLRAMIRAYAWRARLEMNLGMTIAALGRAERVNSTYIARLLPLGFLSPELTQAVLEGRHPLRLSVDRLRSTIIHVDWDAQRRDLART